MDVPWSSSSELAVRLIVWTVWSAAPCSFTRRHCYETADFALCDGVRRLLDAAGANLAPTDELEIQTRFCVVNGPFDTAPGRNTFWHENAACR